MFTKDLFYEKTNTQSFRAMKKQGLTNSNFLVWTGLRQSVPWKLRVNIQLFRERLSKRSIKAYATMPKGITVNSQFESTKT